MHVVVSGDVQGVGYRYTMRMIAREVGVTGWVRNRRDGTVEAEVEGTPRAGRRGARVDGGGPPGSRVDAATVTDAAPVGSRRVRGSSPTGLTRVSAGRPPAARGTPRARLAGRERRRLPGPQRQQVAVAAAGRLGAEDPGQPVLRRERRDDAARLDRAHRTIRDAARQPPAHRPRQDGAGVAPRRRSPAGARRSPRTGASAGTPYPPATPDAPSAKAAATPRRSAIPPAAMHRHADSVDDLRNQREGADERVARRGRRNDTRCPAASAPLATIASTPASSSATASATVVAVPMMRMPRSRARRDRPPASGTP